MTTIAIVIDTGDAARAAEAWRAAVGVSLRGARVLVVAPPADASPAAARARATLALFGHRTDAALDDALAADVIELWRDDHAARPATPARPRARAVVHLVRPGRAPAVAPGDRVLPLEADVDYAAVLDAIAAGAAACVW